MRIKKIAQSTVTQAQILNNKNTSKKAGYSCDYINTLVLGEELFKGDSTGNVTLAKDVTLFHRIKVYGYTTHSSNADRYINFCQEFLVPGQTNRYGLIATAHAGNSNLYIAATMLTIVGTSVTKGNQAVYLTNNTKDDAEVFHITEIRGFYS